MNSDKSPPVERFGLKEQTIEKIQTVFKHYPEIEKAVIYGSRVKGNYRVGSDIDLTLMGSSLTYDILNKVETEIDELLLPYSMDLSLFSYIDNTELIQHIKRVGKVFYPDSLKTGIDS